MLIVCVLFLMSLSQRLRVKLSSIMPKFGLTGIALAAFAMYAMVHVQSRYIGAFVVLFWSDILAAIHLPRFQYASKLILTASVIMLLTLIINIGMFHLEGLKAILFKVNAFQGKANISLVNDRGRAPGWPGEVAEELYRLGIKPKDHVAVIGYAFESYWARLAGVKIVAEMFGWEADPFWLGSPSFQTKVIGTFRSTQANAIVAENVPAYAKLDDWQQVNDTNYFVYLLKSK